MDRTELVSERKESEQMRGRGRISIEVGTREREKERKRAKEVRQLACPLNGKEGENKRVERE